MILLGVGRFVPNRNASVVNNVRIFGKTLPNVTKEENKMANNDSIFRTEQTVVNEFMKNEHQLVKKVCDYLMQQYYKPNMKMVDFYKQIDNNLRIAPDTMKKLLRRTTTTISREMLYKIAVGTGMDYDTANSFFVMSRGGELNPDSLNDLLVINALLDHDSIDDFIEEYREKAGKNIAAYVK